MIKSHLLTLSALLFAAVALLLSGPAFAKDPTGVAINEVDGETVIIVSYEDGVVFFDKDGNSHRKYDFRKGDYAATDVNGDGAVDYVALGKPLFIINGNGEPVWANEKGCSDAALGDIAGESNDLEIFCRRGNTLTVYSNQGNVVWELGVSGMRLKNCVLKDLEGNGKMDIECPAGKKKYLKVSGQGSLIAQEAEVPGEGESPTFTPPGSDYVDDAQENLFDFNGDGTAEEYLIVEDGDTIVASKSSPRPLAITPIPGPAAAAVADLDGDGASEVVVVGDGRIAALDKEADKTVLFDTSFNRNKLKRVPVVTFGTLGVNDLDADSAGLEAALDADALASCYTRKVKKDRFLKVGRVSLRAMVDQAGKVNEVKQSFSTLNDSDVEQCVAKAVKGMTLPAATAEAGGYASIDMVFGYRDE